MKYQIWKRWEYDHADDPTAWKLADDYQYYTLEQANAEARNLRRRLTGRIVEVKEQTMSNDRFIEAYAQLRRNLRDLMFKNGVQSNPGFGDDEIVACMAEIIRKAGNHKKGKS